MCFEDLLERHEQEIYRFARRVTANPEDAADVLQDTFLRAFKAFRKLPPDANHRAWLYRIADSCLSNLRAHYGAKKRQPPGGLRQVASGLGRIPGDEPRLPRR